MCLNAHLMGQNYQSYPPRVTWSVHPPPPTREAKLPNPPPKNKTAVQNPTYRRKMPSKASKLKQIPHPCGGLFQQNPTQSPPQVSSGGVGI